MPKQTANFYNRFSVFYPLVDIFLKPQKRKLFEEVNKLPFGNLLEIGVGDGSHLGLYKTHKITGIDTSSAMLQRAGKQKLENIELIQMDGEHLSFPDQSFDYAVLSHVIAVTGNPEHLLEEVYRILKPNGRIFILNHFTPKNQLRHIDRAFNLVSRFFHFRALFYIESLATIRRFTLLKEIGFGRFSYFKLLILSKA